MSKRKKLADTPERRLRDHWDKLVNGNVRFSPLLGDKPILGRLSTRGTEIDVDNMAAFEIKRQLNGLIFDGFPLSRREYYLALGFCLILGDVPYEEFYKTHWFENEGEFGYRSPEKKG